MFSSDMPHTCIFSVFSFLPHFSVWIFVVVLFSSWEIWHFILFSLPNFFPSSFVFHTISLFFFLTRYYKFHQLVMTIIKICHISITGYVFLFFKDKNIFINNLQSNMSRFAIFSPTLLTRWILILILNMFYYNLKIQKETNAWKNCFLFLALFLPYLFYWFLWKFLFWMFNLSLNLFSQYL